MTVFRLRFLLFLSLALGVNPNGMQLFPVAVAADKAAFKYCKNADEYAFFIENVHREIMKKIALDILKRYSESFSQVNSMTLISFINLHDASKVDPRYGITMRLYAFYGVRLSNLSKEEQEGALQVINEANRIDDALRENFFRENHIFSATQRAQYEALEKMADFVERYFNPLSREEFARTMYPPSESTFLAPLHQKMVKITFESEAGRVLYIKLADGLTFDDQRIDIPAYVARRRFACIGLMGAAQSLNKHAFPKTL